MMAYGRSPLQGEIAAAGQAKAVIGVFELGRDAGARRRTRHLDVVAPGTSAGGAALAARRPLRVALGRNGVVAGVVPIGAPFVDIVAEIVEAVRIRGVDADRLRPVLPARRIVRER